MSDRDRLLRSVDSYYTDKVAAHGATAAGVDWNSEESQELRFAQLLRVVDATTPYSLIDYGCGYGALVGALHRRSDSFSYTGFDVSAAMLEHARGALAGDRRCTLVADPGMLKPAEYAIASGIFNVRLDNDPEAWRAYVDDTIRALDRLGKRGFAFNMLTSYSDAHLMRDDLYYGEPCAYFDLCKREFSRHVALLHDYGLWEFTIVVRKDAP